MATQEHVGQERSEGGARNVVAWVCLVAAAVLTIPAVVGFWSSQTLLNTDRYVATVADLAADPNVQATVAKKISGAVKRNIDIDAIVEQRLGPDADHHAAVLLERELDRAMPQLVNEAAADVVASDAFPQLWADANRAVHTSMLAALSGDQSGAVRLSNGRLVLDLSAMVERVTAELESRGVEQAGATAVPDFDRRIVVVNADELSTAQSLYRIGEPVAGWLIVVVALLYLAAVLLTPRRGRMVVVTGSALVVCGLVLVAGLAVGQGVGERAFTGAEFSAAAGAYYGTLAQSLRAVSYVLIAGGILLVAGAWAAGRMRGDDAGAAGNTPEPKVPVAG